MAATLVIAASLAYASCLDLDGDSYNNKAEITTRSATPDSANTGTITNDGKFINTGSVQNLLNSELINNKDYINKENGQISIGGVDGDRASFINYGNFVNEGQVTVTSQYKDSGMYDFSYVNGNAYGGFYNDKDGTVVLESNSIFEVSSGTFVNQANGHVTNNGNFTVVGDGGVSLNEATWVNKYGSTTNVNSEGHFENRNTLKHDSGANATIDNDSSFDNLMTLLNDGYVNVEGNLDNFGVLNQNGEIDLSGKACVHRRSLYEAKGFKGAGLFLNIGETQILAGGYLGTKSESTFNNKLDATFRLADGTWVNNGTLLNYGLMQFHGGTLENYNDFTNNGDVEVENAIVDNALTFSNEDGSKLSVYSGGNFKNEGEVSDSAQLQIKTGSFVQCLNGGNIENNIHATFSVFGTALFSGTNTKVNITGSNSNLIVEGGSLVNAENATISVESNAIITLQTGGRISNNGASIDIYAEGKFDTITATFDNHGTVEVMGSLNFEKATYNNHVDLNVLGHLFVNGTNFVNSGTLSSNGNGMEVSSFSGSDNDFFDKHFFEGNVIQFDEELVIFSSSSHVENTGLVQTTNVYLDETSTVVNTKFAKINTSNIFVQGYLLCDVSSELVSETINATKNAIIEARKYASITPREIISISTSSESAGLFLNDRASLNINADVVADLKDSTGNGLTATDDSKVNVIDGVLTCGPGISYDQCVFSLQAQLHAQNSDVTVESVSFKIASRLIAEASDVTFGSVSFRDDSRLIAKKSDLIIEQNSGVLQFSGRSQFISENSKTTFHGVLETTEESLIKFYNSTAQQEYDVSGNFVVSGNSVVSVDENSSIQLLGSETGLRVENTATVNNAGTINAEGTSTQFAVVFDSSSTLSNAATGTFEIKSNVSFESSSTFNNYGSVYVDQLLKMSGLSSRLNNHNLIRLSSDTNADFVNNGQISNHGTIELLTASKFATSNSVQNTEKGVIECDNCSYIHVSAGSFSNDGSVNVIFSNQGLQIFESAAFTNGNDLNVSFSFLDITGQMLNQKIISVTDTRVVTQSSSTTDSLETIEMIRSEWVNFGSLNVQKQFTIQDSSHFQDSSSTTLTDATVIVEDSVFNVSTGGTTIVSGSNVEVFSNSITPSTLVTEQGSVLNVNSQSKIISYYIIELNGQVNVQDSQILNSESLVKSRRNTLGYSDRPTIFVNGALTLSNAPLKNKGVVLVSGDTAVLTYKNSELYDNEGNISVVNEGSLSVHDSGILENKDHVQIDALGTLSVSGRFINTQYLENDGNVRVTQGGFFFNNNDLINGGVIDVQSRGSFSNFQTLTNNEEITVEGFFINERVLNNSVNGDIKIESAGGSMVNKLTFDNEGKVEVNGTFTNEGLFSTSNDFTVAVNGSTTNAPNGIIENTLDFNVKGKASNLGHIVNLNEFVVQDGGDFVNELSFDNQQMVRIEGTFNNIGNSAVIKSFGYNSSSSLVSVDVEEDGALVNKDGGQIFNDQSVKIGGLFVNVDSTFTTSNVFNVAGDVSNLGGFINLLGKDRDTSGKTCTDNCKGITYISGTIENQGELVNQGTIKMTGTLTSENEGKTENEGTIENEGGNIEVMGAQFLNSGEVNVIGNFWLNPNEKEALSTYVENTGSMEFEDGATLTVGAARAESNLTASVVLKNLGTISSSSVVVNPGATLENEGTFTSHNDFKVGTCSPNTGSESIYNVEFNKVSAFVINRQTFTILNSSFFLYDCGQILNSNGALLDVQGDSSKLTVLGGAATLAGSLQIGSSARLAGQGGQIELLEYAHVAGHFEAGTYVYIRSSATLDVSGTYKVIQPNYNSGRINFGSNSTFLLSKSFYNYGEIDFDSGAQSNTLNSNAKLVQQGRADIATCGMEGDNQFTSSVDCYRNAAVDVRGNPNLALNGDLQNVPAGQLGSNADQQSSAKRLFDGSITDAALSSDMDSIDLIVDPYCAEIAGEKCPHDKEQGLCVQAIRVHGSNIDSVTVGGTSVEANGEGLTVVSFGAGKIYERDSSGLEYISVNVAKAAGSERVHVTEIEVMTCVKELRHLDTQRNTYLDWSVALANSNDYPPSVTVTPGIVFEGSVFDMSTMVSITDENDPYTRSWEDDWNRTSGDLGHFSTTLLKHQRQNDFHKTLVITLDSVEGDCHLEKVNRNSIPQNFVLIQNEYRPAYERNALQVGDTFTYFDLKEENIVIVVPGGEGGFEPENSAEFVFTVTDGVNNVKFSVPLSLIASPLFEPSHPQSRHVVDDEPPTVSVSLLTVLEGNIGDADGGRTHMDTKYITLSELFSTDVDTPNDFITYTIQSVPYYGNLYKTSTLLSVGDTFTQKDVRKGSISYKTSTEIGRTEKADSFSFTADDGGAVVFSENCDWNKGKVKSFDRKVDGLSCTSNAAFKDINNEGCDVYASEAGMGLKQHGYCYRPSGGEDFLNLNTAFIPWFDMQAIIGRANPSGENAAQECCECGGGQITDYETQCGGYEYKAEVANRNEDTFTMNIRIIPVDDKKPAEVRNQGATIREGEEVTLTSDMLSFSDEDTSEESLIIQVFPEHPQFVSFRKGNQDVSQFTQQDVIEGSISIRYTTEEHTNHGCLTNLCDPKVSYDSSILDDIISKVTVRVHDGTYNYERTTENIHEDAPAGVDTSNWEHGWGNQPIEVTFQVRLQNVDNLAPRVASNPVFEAVELQDSIPLNSLKVLDQDTSSSELTFVVTTDPVLGELSGSYPSSLRYKSTVPIEGTTTDSFIFKVFDPANNKIVGQKVEIIVHEYDRDGPVVSEATPIVINEGNFDGTLGLLQLEGVGVYDADTVNIKNTLFTVNLDGNDDYGHFARLGGKLSDDTCNTDLCTRITPGDDLSEAGSVTCVRTQKDQGDCQCGSGYASVADGKACTRVIENNDECVFARDGVCDDGGVGSRYMSCSIGTDKSDCGERSALFHGTKFWRKSCSGRGVNVGENGCVCDIGVYDDECTQYSAFSIGKDCLTYNLANGICNAECNYAEFGYDMGDCGSALSGLDIRQKFDPNLLSHVVNSILGDEHLLKHFSKRPNVRTFDRSLVYKKAYFLTLEECAEFFFNQDVAELSPSRLLAFEREGDESERGDCNLIRSQNNGDPEENYMRNVEGTTRYVLSSIDMQPSANFNTNEFQIVTEAVSSYFHLSESRSTQLSDGEDVHSREQNILYQNSQKKLDEGLQNWSEQYDAIVDSLRYLTFPEGELTAPHTVTGKCVDVIDTDANKCSNYEDYGVCGDRYWSAENRLQGYNRLNNDSSAALPLGGYGEREGAGRTFLDFFNPAHPSEIQNQETITRIVDPPTGETSSPMDTDVIRKCCACGGGLSEWGGDAYTNRVQKFTLEDILERRIAFRSIKTDLTEDISFTVRLSTSDEHLNAGNDVDVSVTIKNFVTEQTTSTNQGSSISGYGQEFGVQVSLLNSAKNGGVLNLVAGKDVDNGDYVKSDGEVDFVYGPGAENDPISLIALGRNERYGGPNEWKNYDPKNLEYSVEDYFSDEAGDSGNGSEEVVSKVSQSGSKSWHMRFGENSITGSTPFSPPLASMEGDVSGRVFRTKFWFKAASEVPDDSSILVTGAYLNNAASFAIELFHSSYENGLQVRVIEPNLDENGETDIEEFSKYAFLATRGEGNARYPPTKKVRVDQYTAEYDAPKELDYNPQNVDYLQADLYESCSEQVGDNICTQRKEVAVQNCEDLSECKLVVCDEYASTTHCKLASAFTRCESNCEKVLRGVTSFVVNEDVDGCVGIVCANGERCIQNPTGAGFTCQAEREDTKGLICNQKRTICYPEAGRYDRDEDRFTEGTESPYKGRNPYRTVADLLPTNRFISVEVLVRQYEGCGNDDMLVTVDGQQREYLQQHAGERETFRPALECVKNITTPDRCLDNDKVNLPAGCRCIVYEGTVEGENVGSSATFQGPLVNHDISAIRNGAFVGQSFDAQNVECITSHFRDTNGQSEITGLKFTALHPFMDSSYYAPGAKHFVAVDPLTEGPQGFYFDDIQYSNGRIETNAYACTSRDDCLTNSNSLVQLDKYGSYVTVFDQFSTSFEGNRATGRAGLDAVNDLSFSPDPQGTDISVNVNINRDICTPDAGQPLFDFAAGNCVPSPGSFQSKFVAFFDIEETKDGVVTTSPGQRATFEVTPEDRKAPHVVVNTGMQVLEFNGRKGYSDLRKLAQGYPGCIPGNQGCNHEYQRTAAGYQAESPHMTFEKLGPYPATGVLHSSLLSFGDTDTFEDNVISLTVTQEPTLGHLADCGGHGDILDRLSDINKEASGDLHVPVVDNIYQKDLKDARYCYVHTSGEIGDSVVSDLIIFTAADQEGNKLENVEFHINILPVDNAVPTVEVEPAVLKDVDDIKGPSNEVVYITREQINVFDIDTASEDLILFFQEQPIYGTISTTADCRDYPNYMNGQASVSNSDNSCPLTVEDCQKHDDDRVDNANFKSQLTAEDACCICGGGIGGTRGDKVVFTLSDLQNNRVKYTRKQLDHTQSDSAPFNVIDGDDKSGPQTAQSTWRVVVPAVDGEPPKCKVGQLDAEEGQIVQVLTDTLDCGDNLAEANSITITAPRTTTQQGSFSLIQTSRRRRDNSLSFTMEDVQRGNVLYEAPKVADLRAGSVLYDRIKLVVDDGSQNEIALTFTVKIDAKPDGKWEFYTNRFNTRFVVPDSLANSPTCVTVTSNDLMLEYADGTGSGSITIQSAPDGTYWDLEGESKNAPFTILPSNVLRGDLSFCRSARTRTPTYEISVSAEYTADGYPTTSKSGVLIVTNDLQDLQGPEAVNDPAYSVTLLSPSTTLSKSDVLFTDFDSDLTQMVYRVTSDSGEFLQKSGAVLSLGDSFTAKDVADGKVTMNVGPSNSKSGTSVAVITAIDVSGNVGQDTTITAVWDVISITRICNEVCINGEELEVAASEGDRVVLTISRSFSSASDAWVDLSGLTMDLSGNSRLHFEKNENEKEVEVFVDDDKVHEDMEVFKVGIQEVTFGFRGGNDASIRINPSDKPIFQLSTQADAVSEETGGKLVSTVSRADDHDSSESFLVVLKVNDMKSSVKRCDTVKSNCDVIGPATQQIEFKAGQTVGSAHWTIVNDFSHEGEESLFVDILSNLRYDVSEGDVEMKIATSDEPTYSISASNARVAGDDACVYINRTGVDLTRDATATFQFGAGSDSAVRNVDYVPSEDCSLKGTSGRVSKASTECCFSTNRAGGNDEDKTFTVVLVNVESDVGVISVNQAASLIIRADPETTTTAPPPVVTTRADVAYFCGGGVGKTGCDEGNPDKFASNSAFVEVNELDDRPVTLTLWVYRTVSTSEESFYCAPEVGSADLNDFQAAPSIASFAIGESSASCDIVINTDDDIEFTEKFTVSLKDMRLQDVEAGKVNVFIKDSYRGAAVWPSAPTVSDAGTGGKDAICVDYCMKNSDVCEDTGLKPSDEYTWQIRRGSDEWLTLGDSLTIGGTSTSAKVLPSGYLKPGVEVRCGIAPIKDDRVGVVAYSEGVIVSEKDGTCNTVQYEKTSMERFSVETPDPSQGNKDTYVIRALIPKTDGATPVISTKPLGDVGRILPTGSLEHELHTCSSFKQSDGQSVFVYKGTLGGNDCVSVYEAKLSITEMIQCGGSISSDQFGINMITQTTTVDLPIYVSSVVVRPNIGFSSSNQVVNAQFSISYTTSVASGQGIVVSGSVETSASVRSVGLEDANLAIRFVTEVSGRGELKAASSEGPEKAVTVLAPDSGRRRGAEQNWILKTTTPKSDFSGKYQASFIPCMIPAGLKDSEACVDDPTAPLTVILPVDFVQADQPVPARLSLESDFYLMFNEASATRPRDDTWQDFMNKVELGHSGFYSEGETVFGRLSSRSKLSEAVGVSLNRVMICSKNPNTDEVFTYDAGASEYGCLSDLALERLVLIENGAKRSDGAITSGTSLSGAVFGVKTHSEICGSECDLGNTDRLFSFEASALKAGSSYQWYAQAEYSIVAGRKRSSDRGFNVKEIRFNEKSNLPIVSGTVSINGVSKKVFLNEGSPDFILAVAETLGVKAQMISIVDVNSIGSGVSVRYSVQVDAEQTASVKAKMGFNGNELVTSLRRWNTDLFQSAFVENGDVETVEEPVSPRNDDEVVLQEGGNSQASEGDSGSSSDGSAVGAAIGAVVGVVVIIAAVVVMKNRRESGSGKIATKGVSEVEEDMDDIEISLHGTPSNAANDADALESSV